MTRAFSGNEQSPANWGPPSLQFSTITGLTDALPAFSRDDTNSGGAEATWTHGHHNLTFGGDARRVTHHDESPSNPRGSFTFTGAFTGSDVADFLLGLPSTSSIAFGNADRQFRYLGWDAYISDDWRFSPTLTLQLGVRWEFEGAPTERNNGMANLDVAPGFVSVSPVLAGDVGPASGQLYPASVMHDDWRGLQPRLSFAWRPIPASSFLMRGGYGIYRNTGMYLPIDELLSQQPPLSTAFTVASTPGTPLSLANGFLVPATGAANTFAVDPQSAHRRIAELAGHGAARSVGLPHRSRPRTSARVAITCFRSFCRTPIRLAPSTRVRPVRRALSTSRPVATRCATRGSGRYDGGCIVAWPRASNTRWPRPRTTPARSRTSV